LTDKTSSLRADTALYGSAILIDRLLGFFLLPLLTRAISPADYGAWTQTAVTAGLLVPLVLFCAPTVVVRYFSAALGAGVRWRAAGQLGAVALALFALCATLASLLPVPLAALVYGETGRHALVPMLLTLLAADACTELSVAWLRTAGRVGTLAAVLVLRSALRYGVVLLLVWPEAAPLGEWLGRYAAAQLGLALAVMTTTLWVLRRAPVSTSAAPAPPPPLPRLRELLAFAAPLVALALLTSMNGFLDRFLLARWLGLDTVAVYAAAVSLCTIPALFYSVLGFTLFPVLSRHWAERRHTEAARLMDVALRVFLFLCVPVALLLALTGPWLLPRLTTSAYVAAPAVFALLGVSVTALGIYQILLYALLLGGRSRQVLFLALAATAINLALNLLLTPRLGAVGAAAAAAVSNTATVVLAARLVRAVMAWRFPWAGLWTIGWRAGLAMLPWVWLPSASAWLLAAAALGLSAAIYLGLDWARPDSTLRTLLPK
jgi:O-antigen/teichoic acid export membrane protein